MSTHIRPLRADDFHSVARIFFCAVHDGTRSAYSLEQRRAWAGDTTDLPGWQERLKGLTGYVASQGAEPVGFMTIDTTGYIDLAFVLPSAAGSGIGGALLATVEAWATERDVPCLTAAASLVARPFFEKHGWHVLTKEDVERKGVTFRRFQMQKLLSARR